MAREEIQITLTKEENDNLELLKEAASPPATPTAKPLIQRVTQILRARYNEEECKRYFEPISLAIGPLHHEKNPKQGSRFKIGENFKLQLAVRFIECSGRTSKHLYNNVKKEINSLRECYDPKEVPVENWKDEELAWLFLVDGCALLHFIFLDVNDKWKELGGKNDLIAFAKLDLFLLENQLPLQLLEILIGSCNTSVPSEGGGANRQKELKDSITQFINKSFSSLFEQQQLKEQSAHLPTEQQNYVIQVDSDETHPPHLLALLRRRLIVKSNEQGNNQKQDKKSPWQLCICLWRQLMNLKLCSPGDKSRHGPTLRNVKELKAKGIRFKAKENSVSITDIDFNQGRCFCLPTLTLAPILVDDATIPKLLSLIAFEMWPDSENEYEITSYVSFLDSLIDNGEDVKELRDVGVLHNGLGSDEAVAELFNKISNNLVPHLEIHRFLKDRFQEHCNFLLASDLAYLYYTHFRSPWSFLVFLGAIAGLIMTGLETYKSFNEDKPALVVNNNYYYYHH